MSKQSNSSTPITRNEIKRRAGQRMTAEERNLTQEKFLKVFSMTANVRAACLAAGIDRSMVYYWQEHSPEFSIKMNIATQEANDLLLAAAWERGVKGVEKPVVSMGRQVFVEEELPNGKKIQKPLMERVYSDHLLSLLMKARMPEYRDKQQIEHSGPDGRPIQTQQVEVYKVRIPDNGRDDGGSGN